MPPLSTGDFCNVSNSKRFTFGLALALLSATAAAELPQSSILTRYGVTSDQLPKPAAIETTKPAKPIEEKKPLSGPAGTALGDSAPGRRQTTGEDRQYQH